MRLCARLASRLSRSHQAALTNQSLSFLWAIAAIFAILCCSPVLTRGQSYLSQIGSPTFTTAESVELGYVNVANGNLHQAIPIVSLAQRGSRPFAAMLVYDSRIWTISTSNAWQPTNVPNSQGGWRFVTSVDPGTVNYLTGSGTCELHGVRVPSETLYDSFNWTGPDGTIHYFPIETDIQLSSCGPPNRPTGDAFATDSSGFHMYVTSNTTATVYAPDGTEVYPLTKDTNGNYYSTDGNGNVIDTLNRTPVTKTVNGSTTTYAILNSQGKTSNILVTTESISVSTGFGVSGVTEYSGSLTVVKTVQLPDGQSYTLGYDSYGELYSITLPTGGTISYVYSNFADGLTGVNRWISSHTSGGGTTSFGQAVLSLSSCPSGAQACQDQTVTKPDGSQVIYTFSLNNGAWVSSAQYKTGGSPSTILKTVTDTWNLANPCQLPGCTGAANIQKLTEVTALPVSSGSLTKQIQIIYDSIDDQNVAKYQEWNFHTGTLPANPDRETDITYQTGASYAAKNIINRPVSVTVCVPTGTPPTCTGSTNIAAQTLYAYDQVTPSSMSGVAQHDDTNFGTADTIRGNVTQVQRLTSGTTNLLSATLAYDTTGQLVASTDAAGNQTGYSYQDNFYNDVGDGPSNSPQAFAPSKPTNAYLTKVSPPLIPASASGYYFGTGQRALSTDPNSATEYFHYIDPFARPTSTVLPNGGWTFTSYAASETEIDQFKGITGSFGGSGCTGCRHDEVLVDNLGRPTSSILVSDPEGQTTLATTYDSKGRLATTSHPFRSTTDNTYGLETLSYDGLDRVLQVKHPDNSISFTYFGTAVSNGGLISPLCTSGGAGFPVLSVDEAGNKSESWVDGFGRTIETDEPNSTGTLAVPSCFAYDLNNNLISVKNSTQTRAYSYDLASRMTSSATPEADTVSFVYDSDSACPTPNSFPGYLVKRIDARGIRSCFQYDNLNRLTSETYSDSTPVVGYFYDQTSYNGLSITYGKGHLTGMSDGSGQTAWSYNTVGGVVSEQRTIAGKTKSISYAYNFDGTPASITYPSGRLVTYSTSNAERSLSETDASSGFQYAILASYAAPGGVQAVIYGRAGTFNGITESRAFNNRLETTSIQASSSTGSGLNLGFGYSLPGGNNGSISGITDNRDTGRSLPTILYDPLNRITQAKTQATSGTDCWGQGFSPDALGNLSTITVTECTAGALSVTVNSSNQFTPTPTYVYDASGNMTADGTGYAYAFDAENRMKSSTGTPLGNFTYTYDGHGMRVEKSNGSTGTLYWRGLSGNALAETDLNGNIISEYIYFAGRRIGRRDSAGDIYFYNADLSGTTRTITDSAGNICYDADFTPYGQEIVQHTNSCPQNYKFTGYERDAETGLDYAFARYYSSRLGRFLSPDPTRGSLDDPQSLNRYSYTRNNPTNVSDPSGMVNRPGYNGLFGGAGGVGSFLNNLYYSLGYGSIDGGSCEADGLDTPCSIVAGLLAAGAALQCPNNICAGVNRDNLPIQFVAPLGTGGYYQCLNSGAFSTQQAAGTAAVDCADGPSVATNREYVGNIYQVDSNGNYSFTFGTPQGPASGTVDFSDIPDNTEYAGFYHTHGAFDANYFSEQFSGLDGDIGVAFSSGNQGFPTYLATPDGRVEMFDPAQFGVFPNGCVLFGTPVSPGPGISGVPVPACHP
jgi:RHS repeat-associated protein